MPLPCPHPRFTAHRVDTDHYRRLAFCGDKVVENKLLRYE